ncbi:hypothetical protein [Cryptosporangium japonicum]|uniref:Integral membrane protein n=1 Tax=Cryptosporangium japonicum TaxID=80872 RepID=A0ABP3ESC0_9ACTN
MPEIKMIAEQDTNLTTIYRDIAVNTFANLIAAAILWLAGQALGLFRVNPAATQTAVAFLLLIAFTPLIFGAVAEISATVEDRIKVRAQREATVRSGQEKFKKRSIVSILMAAVVALTIILIHL